MPGRDYNKAYALFEQSLGDTSYPVYPKAQPHIYHLPIPCDYRSTSFADRSRTSNKTTVHPERPCVGTHLLPPTPPPGTHSQDPSFGLSNRLTTPELTPDTRHGTPFTSLGAPTPGTTPPSFGVPKPPRGMSHDSSRAESFRTAQEHTSPTSEAESPLDLPLQGTKRLDVVPMAGVEAYALGLRNFDKVTEQAHRRMIAEPDLKRPSREDVETLSTLDSKRSSDSRQKRRKLDKVPRELTFLEDAGHTSLKSPTNQESPSSWLDGSSTGENSPTDQKEVDADFGPSRKLSTPESKFSAPDTAGSPIVEASIVDSPPRHRRRLRHVSKNRELRQTPPNSRHDGSGDADTASDITNPGAMYKSPQQPSEDTDVQMKADIFGGTSGLEKDTGTFLRTRSLLTSRMPRTLRNKTHSWRRSAPGLMARDSAGGLSRNLMDVVPEDSPLPESPQPPSNKSFGGSRVPSQRRSSEHSIVASEGLGRSAAADPFLDPGSARNTFTRSSPVSDASEALVRDATEVQIHAHHNNSLVVVEHPGSSSNSQPLSAESSRTEPHEPNLDNSGLDTAIVTPAKNPRRKVSSVESPLTNPRAPPQPPPSVSVIPPTPSKHEDLSPATNVSAPTALFDRPTISQRAKRYSDSLATSMSRLTKADLPSEGKRASLPLTATAPDHDIAPQKLGTETSSSSLHPQWKPRGNAELGFASTESHGNSLGTGVPAVDDSGGETSAVENVPPSDDLSSRTNPSGRLSVRRLFRMGSSKTSVNRPSSSGTSAQPAGLHERIYSSEASLNNKLGSQRRGLAGGLRQRLRERSMRREEQRHQERQQKLRHSIGPRFYVEQGMNA